MLSFDGMRVFLDTIENRPDGAHCEEDLTAFAFASIDRERERRETKLLDDNLDTAAIKMMEFRQVITREALARSRCRSCHSPFQDITAPSSSNENLSLLRRTRGLRSVACQYSEMSSESYSNTHCVSMNRTLSEARLINCQA